MVSWYLFLGLLTEAESESMPGVELIWRADGDLSVEAAMDRMNASGDLSG